MLAIVETGGKQYKVSEGDIFEVEKLDVAAGEEVTLDKVLLLIDGENVQVGKPYVASAKVIAKVEAQVKGDKIIGYRYKAKKNERKKYGHRQPYTKLRIASIETGA